jgi:hypothetical protein
MNFWDYPRHYFKGQRFLSFAGDLVRASPLKLNINALYWMRTNNVRFHCFATSCRDDLVMLENLASIWFTCKNNGE